MVNMTCQCIDEAQLISYGGLNYFMYMYLFVIRIYVICILKITNCHLGEVLTVISL